MTAKELKILNYNSIMIFIDTYICAKVDNKTIVFLDDDIFQDFHIENFYDKAKSFRLLIDGRYVKRTKVNEIMQFLANNLKL